MENLPFQIEIRRSDSDRQTETLVCNKLLRFIDGQREVYDGQWNGRAVILKLFTNRIKGWRHLKRELRGFKLLLQKEVRTPEVFFSGKTSTGRHALVLEKIDNASTIIDIFNQTDDTRQKVDLLILVTRELAIHHSKGILQKDLHLGNFLFSDEKIYTIDPAQISFRLGQIGKRRSLSELALLTGFAPAESKDSVTRLCREYAEERNWPFEDFEEVLLRKLMVKRRKQVVRKSLKKCLRTSKRCLCIKAGRCRGVFDRCFYDQIKSEDFTDRIDTLMAQGHILKDGNTCFVSRININGTNVVVKRYNDKGFIHSLRHTLKTSRARRGWLHSQRLDMLGIASPKPLAYFEYRKGLLVKKSYLLNEYADGKKLDEFLAADETSKEQLDETLARLDCLLEKMELYLITHGDLKLSNILVTADGPTLIDLDSMKAHGCRCAFQRKAARDVQKMRDKIDRCLVGK